MISTNKKPLISLIVILLATIALDQGSKQYAQHSLLEAGFFQDTSKFPACGNTEQEIARERMIRQYRQSVHVIDGFFDLRYVENCNSAFGLMQGVPEWVRFPFFLIVSVLAVAFIPYLYKRTPADQRLMLYALPFVLGGAIGNLLDRLIYRYVIDFIRWYIRYGDNGAKEVQWPTFNIADAAIVVGIALMLWQMLPSRSKAKPAAGK